MTIFAVIGAKALYLLFVWLLPGRPGSKWQQEGWLPRRRRGGSS